MPSDFTLEEIARAIVRIEESLHHLVRKDLFDNEMRDVEARVQKIEGWLAWGARLVIGGVLAGALSFLLVSR